MGLWAAALGASRLPLLLPAACVTLEEQSLEDLLNTHHACLPWDCGQGGRERGSNSVIMITERLFWADVCVLLLGAAFVGDVFIFVLFVKAASYQISLYPAVCQFAGIQATSI